MTNIIMTFLVESAEQLIPTINALMYAFAGAGLFYLGTKLGGNK
jgi:hypothetical protein